MSVVRTLTRVRTEDYYISKQIGTDLVLVPRGAAAVGVAPRRRRSRMVYAR